MSKLKIRNGNTWEEIPAGGVGVPSGGTQDQYLKKSSSTDYAVEWASFPSVETLTISLNTSGWTENTTWAEKMGNLVIVHVYVQGTTANGKAIASGLPAPRNSITVADIGGSGLADLNTSGSLAISSASTGSWLGATIAYFVG